MKKPTDWKAQAESLQMKLREVNGIASTLTTENETFKKGNADLQVELRRISFERDQLSVSLQQKNKRVQELEGAAQGIYFERLKTHALIRDLQLCAAAGTHLLCGSFWIRGEQLLMAIRRYSEQ